MSAFNDKVSKPSVAARIEKIRWLSCVRIQRGYVRPLVMVAVVTREGEVLKVGQSAVLRGNDMVGLMWSENVVLVYEAILATTRGPLSHRRSNCRRNPGTHELRAM